MKKLWLLIICLILFLCTVGVYWRIQQPIKKLESSKTEISAKKHIIQKQENESSNYILPYTLSAVLPSKTREINFPTFNISFQTPGWIVTSKELGLINPYASLGGGGETFYSIDTTGDATNTFQQSGVAIDFGPRYIAASSTVNDPNYVLFDNTNKNILHDPIADVKVLDNTKLLVKSSIVSSDEIKIYSYLAADDNGNGRGKLGYKYQGDIVLHVELPNYTQSTIDIGIFCYDLDAKNTLSSRCQKVLTTLLSSLQIKNAIILPSTPLYSQKDIFSFLPFVKRQSPIDISTVSSSDNKAALGEPFKSIREQKALTSLQDEDLSVMRCLPQIIYFNSQGTAFATPGGDTAYNNPFHITDTNLLHIISLIQANNPTHMYPTQLLACQTDTGNYIVEYTTATTNITSDDDVHPSQDIANFAEILPNGSLHTITTIPTIHTVTKETTCTTPLLLTQEQQLYVECDLQNPVVPGNHIATGSYLYRIDLDKKSFSLATTCDNTWESKVSCY